VTVLLLLALHLGRMRMLSSHRAMDVIKALEAVPRQIEKILSLNDEIKKAGA